MMARGEGRHIAMVAGEHSGDQLGGKLIPAIRDALGEPVSFSGVGGDAMAGQGCPSLFPLSDIAVMGISAVIPRLPRLIRRVHQTVDAVLQANPDILVILDSPEFTHAVAKRVRRARPDLPVVDYVSPSVWAWRPGRAKKMRRYIDHVLALLPFEPAVHRRLGGPDCTYVGHPLIERLDWIEGLDPRSLAVELDLNPDLPVLVVLPGSRAHEVSRHMKPFGDALDQMWQEHGPFEVVIPVVESVRDLIETNLDGWQCKPHLVSGETAKFQAFRLARAALAVSGTVTLELALCGAPMAVGYILDPVAARLRWLASFQSIVLPNLILEENVFPEFIHEACTGEKLAAAMIPLMGESKARDAQVAGLTTIADKMRLEAGTPSEMAARTILAYLPDQHPHRDECLERDL